MERELEVKDAHENWTSEEAAPESKMTVYFMMKHSKHNVKKLERTLLSVSDPASKAYGKHLSKEQISKILPVSDKAVSAVKNLFKRHGVSKADISSNFNNDMIQVRLTTKQAEEMFGTKVSKFTHKSKTSIQLHRAVTSYSLPAEVAQHVDFIGDLVTLPNVRESILAGADVGGRGNWPNSCDGDSETTSGCKGLVQPAVLNQRYQVDANTTAVPKNSMGVAEFQGQYYDADDLNLFGTGCHKNVTVDVTVGTNEPAGCGLGGCVESLLDIEYIRGVSPEIPLTVIYASEYSLLNYAMKLQSMDSPPLVNSVSYGNDEKQQVSKEYIFNTATQFMKVGAMGLSVLFASGDQGVCGREGCGLFVKKFHPDFPAACPYVTAVGGTDFVTYDIGEEQAWADSGGGFSDHFDIPSWQADAVSGYKSNPAADLPKQSYWNNTGRGYPDVSALGGTHTPYCVVTGKHAEGVAGTSASSPTVAAIFAKLNGIRLSAGKSPLGFLNPFIYKNADAFNDVTKGQNGENQGERIGFKAIEGWDPATGFGTPNYATLAKAVEALP